MKSQDSYQNMKNMVLLYFDVHNTNVRMYMCSDEIVIEKTSIGIMYKEIVFIKEGELNARD